MAWVLTYAPITEGAGVRYWWLVWLFDMGESIGWGNNTSLGDVEVNMLKLVLGMAQWRYSSQWAARWQSWGAMYGALAVSQGKSMGNFSGGVDG